MKIYDCSNSIKRPQHRGGGGPLTNDIMRYLKEYSHKYNCEFVENLYSADVIITNDVYPEDVLLTDIPRVKRMCSPFWKTDLQYRNVSLNSAAEQSDIVIFISEYSKKSYIKIFGEPKFNNVVIKHWVDPNDYKVAVNKFDKFSVISSATDWNREEKRLIEILNLAVINPSIDFYLIGKSPSINISNVKVIGYLNNAESMNSWINKCNVFLNLTYRDAATKTVPQALSCKVPIIYSSSGGVGEYAGENGICIKEVEELGIEENIRYISRDINNEFNNALKNLPIVGDLSYKFKEMLDNYYNIILSAI